MAEVQLTPTDDDYADLWRKNPVAKEQLIAIVAIRQMKEAQDELASVRAINSGKVTDIGASDAPNPNLGGS